MFGLGLVETAIVLGLAYLAFRHVILRRWPGLGRTLNYVFLVAVALMLLFGYLTHVR